MLGCGGDLVAEADAKVGGSHKELRGALPTGTRLSDYELISVLGQGGFGITYLARDTNLDSDVAIKEYLPISLALREGGTAVMPRSTELAGEFVWGRERFLDEARTLAKLSRAPAIVRVHRFLEANGTAYMVMALAAGDTLAQRLAGGKRLSQAEIEGLLYPLLEGLEEVHAAGFLHRDIKPANIIVDGRGNPTLIDFGASRAAMAGRTSTLTAIFTPGYAAAEQFTSAKQGPWTDIYGLSATLYHSITGQVPPSAFDRMLGDAYEPLSNTAPAGFSAALLRAIDAGLMVRAGQRPQSIAEWRPMLHAEIEAHPASYEITAVLPKPGSASPSPARLSATAAVEPRGRKSRRVLWGAGLIAMLIAIVGIGYLAKSMFLGTAVQSMTADELTQALEERRKADTAAAEKKKLEEEAQRKADADASAKRQADEALAEAQKQRQQAEAELANLKAGMEARQKAEEAGRQQAAADAQRTLDEAVKKNKAQAEMAALRKADEEAKAKAAADAAAKQQADEEAQRKAEAEAAASRQAEEEAKAKAALEAEAKQRADEALAKAQAERQKADEEAARQEAEAAAKTKSDMQAKADADAKAKAEAEAKARADADAKAKVAADAKAKAEADAALAEKKAAEAGETALKLAPLDRQHAQVALTGIGFDTRGKDGAFGPRSREMIAAWQKARNQAATGFLDPAQLQALLKEGGAAIAKYDLDQKKNEEAKRKSDEVAAKAASAVPASPAPSPAAPLPTAASGSVASFDGAYRGSFSIPFSNVSNNNLAQLTLRLSNGAGSGVLTMTGNQVAMSDGTLTVRISANGDLTGQGEMVEPSGLKDKFNVRGHADGGHFKLDFSGLGRIPVSVTVSKIGN
jgi:peptidoglycan hydrolase-like protein with peptidoglycan-binding domain